MKKYLSILALTAAVTLLPLTTLALTSGAGKEAAAPKKSKAPARPVHAAARFMAADDLADDDEDVAAKGVATAHGVPARGAAAERKAPMLSLHVNVGRLTPEAQYQVQLKLGAAGTLTSPVKGDSPKLMTNSGGHLNVRFTNKAEQLEEGETVFQLNPDAFKEVKDLSEVTGILIVRVSDNKVVAEAEFGARGRGRQK